MISVGCCRSEFKWEKEEKFHVVSSSFVSEEEECEEEINLALRPPLTPPRFSRIVVEKKKKKQQRVKKTKTKSRIIRMSTSSADEYSGILSGTNTDWDNNEEETESLVSSSRSCYDFSSDDSSTDFNPHLETICETTTMRRRHKRNANTKRRSIKQSRPSFSSSKGRRSSVSTSSDSELPARLSVFKKLIPCSVDGKVKESFAIVKKSQDPY
nr:BAC19.6 [Solanum lycopersicum]